MSCRAVAGGCSETTPKCDPTSGVCGSTSKTVAGGRCDATFGRCQPPKCKADADCGKPSCRAAGGSCMESVPRCNTSTGVCGSSQRTVAGGVCAATGLCVVPPQCRADPDCGKVSCRASAGNCTETTPKCDTSRGVCGSAIRTVPGGSCDSSSGLCQAPRCKADSDCGTPSCRDVSGGCTERAPKCDLAKGTCSFTSRTLSGGRCLSSTGLCENGAPVITSLAPAIARLGLPYLGTIAGRWFESGTAVEIALPGSTTYLDLKTLGATLSYLSSTRMTVGYALVPTVLAPGDYLVRVKNPDGRTSNPVVLTVRRVTSLGPVLSSISPNSATRGKSYSGTLFGSGFISGSRVEAMAPGIPVFMAVSYFGGATRYVSATSLSLSFAPVPTALKSGTYYLRVCNLGSLCSPATVLQVLDQTGGSKPSITSVVPATATVGSAYAGTVSGSGFDPGVSLEVRVDALATWVPLAFFNTGPTRVVVTRTSAASVSFSINPVPSSYLFFSVVGKRQLRAINPNGQVSNSRDWTIVTGATSPVITSLNPASATVGKAYSGTIQGSGFDRAATVEIALPGSTSFVDVSTLGAVVTWVSARQLNLSMAAVPTLIPAGAFSVRVNNGSGRVSNSVVLTITR